MGVSAVFEFWATSIYWSLQLVILPYVLFVVVNWFNTINILWLVKLFIIQFVIYLYEIVANKILFPSYKCYIFCTQSLTSVVWLFTVAVLHDHQLAHTDLKPENILFVDSESEYYTTKTIRNKVWLACC